MNLHIYPSPFRFESRILRETKSIIDFKLADKVIIASGWSKGLSELEHLDPNRSVKRFKLFFNRFTKNPVTDTLKYFEFIIKTFFFYKDLNVKIVNCHSLFVLPIGYLLKKFDSKIRLIYDAHELESEKAGLKKISKYISAKMERFLIGKVDKVIVVSPSIGHWYQHKYGISNVVVIRNTPKQLKDISRNSIFNNFFRIPDESLIFIYQGIINKGRGIELLLNVFAEMDLDKHLVVMGYGPQVDLVTKAEKKHSNIHFHQAVPPTEIYRFTSGADIGLSIIENVCLSYYYSLPNKLFEYLHSGLPVIVSNFPDMSSIINDFNCGWVTEVNQSGLANTIRSINRSNYEDKLKGVVNIRKEINWDKESILLSDAFQVLP